MYGDKRQAAGVWLFRKRGELRTEVMNCRDFSARFQAEMLLPLVNVSVLVNY